MTENENKSQVERLSQLNAMRESLRDQSVRAQAEFENIQRERARLQKEAVDRFGTHDVNKLKDMLARWEDENVTALEQYERNLTNVSSSLKEIQRQLDESSGSSNNDESVNALANDPF